MKKILSGHVSPETAYVVKDYPYGFRLRCKIRYWLESDAKKGTRLVSQTTNPKASAIQDIWNKPKKSTYAAFGVLFLDDNGRLKWTTSADAVDLQELRAWLACYAPGLDDIGFAAASRTLSQKKSYERFKAAGIPWQDAGIYAVIIGMTKKSDGMPFSTADAIARHQKKSTVATTQSV